MPVKHIVSFSGGKDSTAMLLMMLERGMQIDETIFCDTGKEFPAMYPHIAKVEQMIGIPITVLRAEKPFDYWMFEHVKVKGKSKGSIGYGWPLLKKSRWCTSTLKRNLAIKYLNDKYGSNYTQYVGYSFDEHKRVLKDIDKNMIFPLYDWRITEAKALQYCYEKGFNWDGLYDHFNRVSCWCCPFQSLKELRSLYYFYPELWAELKDMDARSLNSFRVDHSLESLELRFKNELVG